MNRRLVALTVLTVAVGSIAARPPADASPSVAVAPAAAPAATPTDTQLAIGARGTSVSEMQARFASYGYTIAVDGWFGPQTDRVVRSWQRSNGLLVDGIVGPRTAASLALAGDGTASSGAQAERGAAVSDGPGPLPLPVDGDCESWRPILDRYRMPFDTFRPLMQREGGCRNVHSYRASTRDDSFGPLQVNRWGRLAGWWDAGGYTAAVMATPEGAIAAAAVLYHACGLAPWTPPYGCNGSYQQTPAPRWGEWP